MYWVGLYKYGGEDGERFPTHKSGSATNIICVVEVETQFQVLRRFYIYTKILYFYKDSVEGLLKRAKKYSSSIRLGIGQKIYTTQFSGARILHTEKA